MDRYGPSSPMSGHDVPEARPGDNRYEVVASYTNYQDAQRAVDHLSDSNFDVRSISIVAGGISFVERVTGRLDWWRAATGGLTSGAVLGSLVGFIFGIFSFFEPIRSAVVLAFYGLVIGAVLGAIFGLAGYLFSGGKRDFTSVGGFRADRYDVTAHPNVAEEARRLLQQLP